MSTFVSIEEAKLMLNFTDGQLQSEIAKGNLSLVFFYDGLATNKSINKLHEYYDEDPFAKIPYDMGDTEDDNAIEPTGHISFHGSAWLECKNIESLTKGKSFQYTAKIYQTITNNDFKKGNIVGMFDFIPPKYRKIGIFPDKDDNVNCGYIITKSMLHIPKDEIQNLLKNSKSATNCNTIKKEHNEGQGDSLLILGAVMSTIKSVAKPNYTDDKLIEAILENYKNIYGISESTLKKKFSESKRHLKQKFE